jgi:hypothetical protein
MTVDRRREPRAESSLAVLVWGADAQGLPFAQAALARNISGQGALLFGINQALRYGDLIIVQYQKLRARFRVVWTRNTSNGDKTVAAVHKLESEQCPWKDELQLSGSPGSETAHDIAMSASVSKD